MISYYNTLLFPVALVERMASKVVGIEGDRTLRVPAKPLNASLHSVFAFEKHLLGTVPLPFGLSIIALATKDGSSETR